jgi:hypothetical protein
MKHLTEAVRSAVKHENWHAALALALTLPDICSKANRPNAKSSQRFMQWVDRNFSPSYTSRMPGAGSVGEMVWLSGVDFYALRCAVLHEGSFDTSGHMKNEVSRVFKEFQFSSPLPNGNSVHRNSVDGKLQLEVNQFALDVASAVDVWVSRLEPDSKTRGRLENLMVIDSVLQADGSIRF